jgi:hypothetical protein
MTMKMLRVRKKTRSMMNLMTNKMKKGMGSMNLKEGGQTQSTGLNRQRKILNMRKIMKLLLAGMHFKQMTKMLTRSYQTTINNYKIIKKIINKLKIIS